MHTLTVLIVEDDPMVTEVNRQYVEAVDGFQVTGTARTGPEGVRAVQELVPDLVVLDIYLPGSDGISVLKEIRRLNLPVDVMMVTAAADAGTIQEVLRCGAVDYIIKPFQFERIRRALAGYRQMRQQLAGSLSQEQVDQLTAPLGGFAPVPEAAEAAPVVSESEAPPKGLTDWTLRQVALHLVNQERPVTALEVADAVGLARVTARRYLDYLVQQGRLRVVQQYGTVGRPVHRYVLR